MENLEKQLQNVRKIRMTNDERDLMRLNINKFMDNHIPELSYTKTIKEKLFYPLSLGYFNK